MDGLFLGVGIFRLIDRRVVDIGSTTRHDPFNCLISLTVSHLRNRDQGVSGSCQETKDQSKEVTHVKFGRGEKSWSPGCRRRKLESSIITEDEVFLLFRSV